MNQRKNPRFNTGKQTKKEKKKKKLKPTLSNPLPQLYDHVYNIITIKILINTRLEIITMLHIFQNRPDRELLLLLSITLNFKGEVGTAGFLGVSAP